MTAWKDDLAAALATVQQEVFEAHEYFPACDHPQYRPASLAELWQDERIQESGTHSILDIRQLLDPVEHPVWPTRTAEFPGRTEYFGTMRPLPADLIQSIFGTSQPTLADYERSCEQDDLHADHHIRWTGVCVVLHDSGRPSRVAFWGSSGC